MCRNRSSGLELILTDSSSLNTAKSKLEQTVIEVMGLAVPILSLTIANRYIKNPTSVLPTHKPQNIDLLFFCVLYQQSDDFFHAPPFPPFTIAYAFCATRSLPFCNLYCAALKLKS